MRIRKTTILPLVAFALVLTACKVGKNYQPPELEVPKTYLYTQNANDSLRDVKWWELFNDPVLDTLIATALTNNQDLRIAAENVFQARTALNIQQKELLPKVNVQAGATRGNFAGFVTPSVNNNFNVAGTLSWEIDLWGKLRRLNEAARADYFATEYGLRSVRLSLITEVASAYLSLKEFEASLVISEQTLQLRDSSLRLVQARFDRGYAAEIDLNQAQIQRAIAASAVPRFKRLKIQTENIISLLIGTSPQPILSQATLQELSIIPEIPAGLPSELLARRPDLLEAEQFIVAENALVGVAIANRFPSLSLTGLLGTASGGLGDLTSEGQAWSIGADLLGPIFLWGQNKRRVEIQKSRLEQSFINYEKQVITAFREVEDALVSIENFRQEVDARQDHVTAAVNAQFLSGERYDKGVTSYLEYLESQRQAFEAQLSLVDVQKELLESYVRLYKALGGGWEASDPVND